MFSKLHVPVNYKHVFARPKSSLFSAINITSSAPHKILIAPLHPFISTVFITKWKSVGLECHLVCHPDSGRSDLRRSPNVILMSILNWIEKNSWICVPVNMHRDDAPFIISEPIHWVTEANALGPTEWNRALQSNWKCWPSSRQSRKELQRFQWRSRGVLGSNVYNPTLLCFWVGLRD